MHPKAIVIFGPTSSGKTALSLEVAAYLAETYNLQSEMINADSRQVYKSMNIGTAKVSSAIRKQYTHHRMSVVPPTEQYTTDQFQADGRKVIEAIIGRGHMPIIVGGTGTYVMSLVGDRHMMKAGPIPAHTPETLLLVPYFERQSLYRKIEANVDQMFKDGLYNEVKNIITAYHAAPLQLRKTHGYREFIEYARDTNKNVFRLNPADLGKIAHLIKVHTKKYAMHQSSWLDKMEDYHMVRGMKDARPLIDAFVTRQG